MFEDGRIIPRRLSMQKVQEYRIIKPKLRNANSQMPLVTAKLIFYYKLKFFRSYINLAFPFFSCANRWKQRSRQKAGELPSLKRR